MIAKDRVIAAALAAAMLGAVLFIAAYATGGSRLYEGLSLALSAAGLCGAAVGWAFWILPDEQVEDERDDYPSGASDRAAEDLETTSGLIDVTRKRLLTRMLYTALGIFGLALIVPIRSLGPALGDAAFHTKWRKGLRMQRENGSFVKASDLNVDSVATVFPEGAVGDAQSQTVLIRVGDGVAANAGGYIAYSKVCTHAGCPVALYRTAAKQLMCPCHQSIFDVVNDGAVVAGPADHALPRLPIEVGSDGYLRATGDYPEPVGPGFWERG
ncbi:MAG: Rieske (2Fe-2S) protein [Candidatus Eremiobacteraeota bacterium]|nr:Rieske (2Fe-2S) protein [Candidatus Eremiobacteraeota bacterium]